MSQTPVPFLFAVHSNEMANPCSVSIVTELRAFQFQTSILTAPPDPEAFVKLPLPVFPVFDGEVAFDSGIFWARIDAQEQEVPAPLKKLKWCYKIDRRAAASPEALVRCATEIKVDVQNLLRPQSAVRHASQN